MLTNYIRLYNSTENIIFLQNSLNKTPVLVDKCYDDWQWWLHAWVHAYSVDPDIRYLQRAADIFEAVAKQWSDVCGGGLIWCPQANGYKNAITNELFLVSSMLLHPYTALLRRPPRYYLDWAIKEWNWFAGSGMLNAANLVNDGLDNNCHNNNQTTWSYNQGVLLTGLALLANATNNASLITVGSQIFAAVTQHLLDENGVLTEPCGSTCGADGHLFKGIFVRHLQYFASRSQSTSLAKAIRAFLTRNAASLLNWSLCGDIGTYGSIWDKPCNSQDRDTATFSSALDLLWAAQAAAASVVGVVEGEARGEEMREMEALKEPQANRVREQQSRKLEKQVDNRGTLHHGIFRESLSESSRSHGGPGAGRVKSSNASNATRSLGVGRCVDVRGQSMPACVKSGSDEAACRAALLADRFSLGYSFYQPCLSPTTTQCSVYTTAATCPPTWPRVPGPASSIDTTATAPLTLCVVRD
eukprot:m.126738 g.126738  ORF g.126738 m.126738 type:complete len:471 (-) comp14695_c0_seq1:29-1441(-)